MDNSGWITLQQVKRQIVDINKEEIMCVCSAKQNNQPLQLPENTLKSVV